MASHQNQSIRSGQSALQIARGHPWCLGNNPALTTDCMLSVFVVTREPGTLAKVYKKEKVSEFLRQSIKRLTIVN